MRRYVAHQSRNCGSLGNTRRAFVDPDWSTPLLAHHFEKLFALFCCRSPRILRVANSFRVRADHHERQSFLGIGRSEETAHWTTFGNAAQRCAFGTDRIHHRAHVVHALFECRQLIDRDAIGKACAAFVKKNQTRKRGESQQEAREARLAPEVFEVRNPAHHKDEIERRVADHLVRDVHVAAARVHRFRWTMFELVNDFRGRNVNHARGERGRRRLRRRVRRRFAPAFVRERSCFLLHRRLSDVCDETIASLRHCLNVLFAFLTFAERFSQYGNVLRQVVFLDKTVGPHLFHQLFLGQHVAGVFEQYEQGVEHFRRQRHLAVLFEEEPLSRVNPKAVK